MKHIHKYVHMILLFINLYAMIYVLERKVIHQNGALQQVECASIQVLSQRLQDPINNQMHTHTLAEQLLTYVCLHTKNTSLP